MGRTGFTPEQVALILLRDGGICAVCGRKADTANHRKNRGAGGRPSLNTLDNGCAICHYCNDLIEQDSVAAADARALGAKLSDSEPLTTPLWSRFYVQWIILYPYHCVLTGLTDKANRPDDQLPLYTPDAVAFP
jgi:hypothetical protein